MARPLRLDFPGALHHITSRGNERRPIFRSDGDRIAFLDLLGKTAERFGWLVYAYCLMTSHFHLMIKTPEATLSRGMHWLNGSYAAKFNKRRKRSGHLFQGRFHSYLIDSEAYFTEVLRYVVLNPVRAKMVERPEQYRWSSYRATAGLADAPDWLALDAALASFGPDRPSAHEQYQRFVLAKVDSEERLWDKVINGIYLGTTEWAKEMRVKVESKLRSTDHPMKQRAIGRPTIQKVITTVAHVANTTDSVIRATRGGPLRDLVAWFGWHEGWTTLRSIAASLRIRSEGHVSGLIRRCERSLGRDPALLGQFDLVAAALRT
jgi:REP element-mobilizing transposase RayT